MFCMFGLRKQYGHTVQGISIYAAMQMILSVHFNIVRMRNAFTRR